MRVNANNYKDQGLSFNGSVTLPFSFEPPVEIGMGVAIFSDVKIGAHSYVNGGTIRERVRIGRFCSIANGVVIGAPNHSIDLLSTHPFATRCPIDEGYGYPFRKNNDKSRETIIGNDVWIGVNAIVIEGVNIGTGAVIGAGAVVTKDVPPYGIALGTPAKVIRYRFPDDVTKALLKSEWWMYPVEFLKKLPTNNISECVNLCKGAEELKSVISYVCIRDQR